MLCIIDIHLEVEGVSEQLEFQAQVYPSGFQRLVPIVYSDNDIALEDDVIFQIGLQGSSDIVDIGGDIPEVGGDSPLRTFGIANITIRDDDGKLLIEIQYSQSLLIEIQYSHVVRSCSLVCRHA